MKKYGLLIVFIFSQLTANAANILVVGDSHTAGPFGKFLKEELSLKHNVAVYGHSSSAPINWIEEKNTEFSGGVFHGAFIDGVNLVDPAPVHWRTKVATPKFKDFLSNMLKYPSWIERTGEVKPDIAVIALGANDLRTISFEDGTATSNYQKRQVAILSMLEMLEEKHIKCLWIAPPDSVMKPKAQQDTLYHYLEEAIESRCEFFSSRHFVARKWLPSCDGVHFSCNSESYQMAKEWARQAAYFVNANAF